MSSVDFRVSSAEVASDAYVVTVAGDADPYAAPALAAELGRLVDDGAREVIVDLLDVPFIDSTVLGVLLRASQRLRADGGEFVLVSDDPRVLRAFEITGLSAQFRFERTLASAVERALERLRRVSETLPENGSLRTLVEQLRVQNAQLEQALESRIVIEQAKGVLAERYRLTCDDAFRLLRGAARSNQMRIHDLARRVVLEAETPLEIDLVRNTRSSVGDVLSGRGGGRV